LPWYYFFVHSSDALQAVVTALYCKILVILGLAFPMAEVISAKVPHGYYQLFYVYLYVGSLLFLLFIYVDLLRTRRKQRLLIAASKKNAEETDAKKVKDGDDESSCSSDSSDTNEDLVPRPRVHYGSFYLRLGAVCE
jgi:hypothetical protein